MIHTTIVDLNDAQYVYTRSDAGMMIEREDGALYEEAYDVLDTTHTYTETDQPIEVAEDPEMTQSIYAQAARIMLGEV